MVNSHAAYWIHNWDEGSIIKIINKAAIKKHMKMKIQTEKYVRDKMDLTFFALNFVKALRHRIHVITIYIHYIYIIYVYIYIPRYQ